MLSLALVSFIAGILTILAPCVLPVLPVILAGSIGEKWKYYPFIVTLSLALSVVLFTLLLKASSLLIDVSPDFWKYFSGVILIFLGCTYMFPHLWARIGSKLFGSKANTSLDHAQDIGNPFLRAVVTGAVLGPVFSSCSPTYSLLLATVFPVSFLAWVGYVLLYAFWLSLILLLIAQFGSSLVRKLRIYADERWIFRKVLGIILALVWFLIVTGIDKKLELMVSSVFDITSIEQSILEKLVPSQKPTIPLTSSIWVTWDQNSPQMSIEHPLDAPEFPKELTEWINSNPLTMASLKGRVVLIDFWTYSCINCQRTLPYLTAWDKKYRDQWLTIIWVHAPEFAFEKVRKNVEKAVKEAHIEYPVMLDNDFITWNAYANRYWPAKYFIDRTGKLRHTHFGEWEYAESEKIIQYLLSEGGEKPLSSEIISNTVSWDTSVPSWPPSPETYLGIDRRENLVSEKSILSSNEWSLLGKWKSESESITSIGDSKLKYTFSGKDVYLVLWWSGKISVKVDGKIQFSGKDVQNWVLSVDSDRMYHLIHSDNFLIDRVLELDFSPGISAYAFTFWG